MVFAKIQISEKFWAARSAAQKFSDKFFKIYPEMYAQRFSDKFFKIFPKMYAKFFDKFFKTFPKMN